MRNQHDLGCELLYIQYRETNTSPTCGSSLLYPGARLSNSYDISIAAPFASIIDSDATN